MLFTGESLYALFLQHGEAVVTVGEEGTLKFWSLANGKLLHQAALTKRRKLTHDVGAKELSECDTIMQIVYSPEVHLFVCYIAQVQVAAGGTLSLRNGDTIATLRRCAHIAHHTDYARL